MTNEQMKQFANCFCKNTCSCDKMFECDCNNASCTQLANFLIDIKNIQL